MVKKAYQKPAMQVVKIQQMHLICSSPGAKSLNSSDGFIWTNDLDEDDV